MRVEQYTVRMHNDEGVWVKDWKFELLDPHPEVDPIQQVIDYHRLNDVAWLYDFAIIKKTTKELQ